MQSDWNINFFDYDRITILTGAGISAPSGIKTFRGDPDSVWNTPGKEMQGTIAWALSAKEAYWRGWGSFRKTCAEAQPNAAHVALADLQRRHKDVTLITQNVDGLHQRAGSTDVIELHGSAFKNRCRERRCRQPDWDDTEIRTRPPACPSCGVAALPGMTFFGEYLNRDTLKQATLAAEWCDLYVVIGSSGTVPPASTLAFSAKDYGARTVLINRDPWETSMSHFDDVLLGYSADVVLPALVQGNLESIRVA